MTSPNTARGLNVAVGIWLFISAFVWTHTQAQLTNTWILGVITAVVALVAMYARSQVRFVNTLAAIYLFISTLALPSVSGGTIWNNILCAIAIFILSLVPGGNERNVATGMGGAVRRAV